MRNLLYDEISTADMEAVRNHLKRHALPASIQDVYFVEFPDELLNAHQQDHPNCSPHCFALEAGRNWIKIELLVRSLNTLHCSCIRYADRKQMEHILDFVERLIEVCGIRT